MLTLPAVEEVRELRLQILERGTLKLVTVVELLSPTNKTPGPDREAYLAKRYRQVSAGVGFVEIDLLRAGARTVGGLPDCDSVAVVARRSDLPTAEVWPARLADPLPAVPVPLLSGEAEPRLDLQTALHAVYDEVGYADFIYLTPLDPPLTPEQAAWAAGFLPPEAAR